MKILSKIKRRTNEDELPRRGEYVEMELYDTDRNPLEFPEGGGESVWKRYDFDPAVPFNVERRVDGSLGELLVGPIDLVVERPSFVILFVGGHFDVVSGGDSDKTITVSLEVFDPDYGFEYAVQSAVSTDNLSGSTDMVGGYNMGVFKSKTYSVNVRCWTTADVAPVPVVSVTEIAATIALLPAGLTTDPWGGGVGT